MFNTVAQILRPDAIRLFIVLLAALVSVAFAAVARWLRGILARSLERDRESIPAPLTRVLSGPSVVGLAAAVAPEAALTRGRIVDRFGRLRCLWARRRRHAPPR